MIIFILIVCGLIALMMLLKILGKRREQARLRSEQRREERQRHWNEKNDLSDQLSAARNEIDNLSQANETLTMRYALMSEMLQEIREELEQMYRLDDRSF